MHAGQGFEGPPSRPCVWSKPPDPQSTSSLCRGRCGRAATSQPAPGCREGRLAVAHVPELSVAARCKQCPWRNRCRRRRPGAHGCCPNMKAGECRVVTPVFTRQDRIPRGLSGVSAPRYNQCPRRRVGSSVPSLRLTSPHFAFPAVHDPLLADLLALAECTLADEPVPCALKPPAPGSGESRTIAAALRCRVRASSSWRLSESAGILLCGRVRTRGASAMAERGISGEDGLRQCRRATGRISGRARGGHRATHLVGRLWDPPFFNVDVEARRSEARAA